MSENGNAQLTAAASKNFNLSEAIQAPEVTFDDLEQIPRYVLASNRNRKELESLLNDWDKLEKGFSRKVDGNVKKALALMLLNKDEEAFEVLKTSKSIPETYYILSVFHRRREEFDQMAVAAGDGYSRFKDFKILSLLQVEALLGLHETEKAKKLWNKLHKELQGSAEYLYLEAMILEQEGEYDEALDKYEAALVRDGNHVRTLFRKAYLCDIRGKDTEAINLYERIRTVLPSHVGATMNLGVLYEDHLRWDEALECFETIVAQYPDNERARMFCVDVIASKSSVVHEEDERKKDERSQILKIPVTDFELSVRSRNCLNKMGIRSLGDLIMRSEQELLEYKNFGETSLNEIREMLASKGLRLGQSLDDSPEPTDEAQPEMLARSIDTLQLSVRARKVMDRLGIRSIGQLVQKSEAELLGERNFGQTSLDEIQKQLKSLGINLASSK